MLVWMPLLSILPAGFSQTDEQLAQYYKRFPEADVNADGKLSAKEAKNHRRGDPSRGDNLESVSEIPAVDVPLAKAPLEVSHLESPDGVKLDFAWRKPSEDEPLPAIVFLHGGGGMSDIEGLKKNLMNGAIQTRFLDKGFITVQSTRRPYWIRQGKTGPTGFDGAVEDTVRVVDAVKQLKGVDRDKVILYGGSGGGILAIVTAAHTKVAAVVAGEPATVVALDPKQGKSSSPAEYQDIMDDPRAWFTGDRKKETLDWMKRVSGPVLVLQGDRTGLYKTNFEILIPEMKRLGKEIAYVEFPGKSHGFYWGTTKTGATLETVDRIIDEADTFIRGSFTK